MPFENNFFWRPGQMRIILAMAAGVTNTLWNFNDLMAGEEADQRESGTTRHDQEEAGRLERKPRD